MGTAIAEGVLAFEAGPPAGLPVFDFQRDLVALMPQLRKVSRSICHNQTLAEDIAQEALAKAWRARERFEPGTNLRAWVVTILRNEFCSHARRAWREAHWDREKAEQIAAPPNEQEWTMELAETAQALRKLPDRQRKSLILVAVGGLSYEDAAKISNVPCGTIKSRVARARAALHGIMNNTASISSSFDSSSTIAPDDVLSQLRAIMPVPVRTPEHV